MLQFLVTRREPHRELHNGRVESRRYHLRLAVKNFLQNLRDRAHRLKRETMALYFAARDPATPWYAKAFVVFVVAYALSPIDPIPDFIPVLGLLDEIILLPFALAFAIRLIPAPIMDAARIRASEMSGERPRSYTAAVLIVLIWIAAIVLTSWVVYRAW